MGLPKTKASKGPVPLHPSLAEFLLSWKQKTPYSQPGDWVFASFRLNGKQPRVANMLVEDYLRPAAAKAGILSSHRDDCGRLVEDDPRRFGFHNLRHSLASFLVRIRTDPKTVQTLLRHSDVKLTLQFYSHAVNQDRMAAAGVDRGWALENAWISGWKQPPDLSDWRRDVAGGTRPAAIFNATAAENGERFVIASTDRNERGTIDFSTKFLNWDIPVATAARLSATFPYVTPMARASDGPLQYRFHVADGGYYDNSGVLSAVEWLTEARDALRNYQILFVAIDSEQGSVPSGKTWSWQRQISAPVETLKSVRTSSQNFRDELELTMALEYLNQEKIKAQPALFDFRSGIVSPLSWHLNKVQLKAVHQAWEDPHFDNARKAVYSGLGCQE
jgi:hypothetical protein